MFDLNLITGGTRHTMHDHDVLYRYKSHPNSLAQCSVSKNTGIMHGVQLTSEGAQPHSNTLDAHPFYYT